VPKKVNKLMATDHRHNSNKIKDGMNDMTVNDSEMCVR